VPAAAIEAIALPEAHVLLTRAWKLAGAWSPSSAAFVALTALVALTAFVALTALVAFAAFVAFVALGTVPSVDALMLAPVSVLFATLRPVTAPFLSCTVSTEFADSFSEDATAVPLSATNSAR
jgi:hypothetical protein